MKLLFFAFLFAWFLISIGCKEKREQPHLIMHYIDTSGYKKVYTSADSSFIISIYNHACIYDSCPHITVSKDSIITIKGLIYLEGKLIGSSLIDTTK